MEMPGTQRLLARRAACVILHIEEDQQTFGYRLQTKEIKESGQRLLQIGSEHAEYIQKSGTLIKVKSVHILSEEEQERDQPGQKINSQDHPCDHICPARQTQDAIAVKIRAKVTCRLFICFAHHSLHIQLYFALCYNYGSIIDF